MSNCITDGGADLAARRIRALLVPLLWGAVLTLTLFSACELAEQTWAVEADPGLLHGLHLARGILTSLAVAAFVAWLVLRASSRLLPEPLAARAPLVSPVLAEAERILQYARWFIALRWIAALMAGGLWLLSAPVLGWIPEDARWPLLGVVALVGVSNVVYLGWLRRGYGASAVLAIQGYVDLVLLVLLLHFSGGIENPLTALFLLHVIIGGILLSRRQCYGLAAAGSVLFGVLGWAEWSGFAEQHSLTPILGERPSGPHLAAATPPTVYVALRVGLQAALLFLTAYFLTTIADRLRRHEYHLQARAEAAQAEQQLLERALDTTGTALRVLDRDLITRWANRRWTRWFGERSAVDAAAPHLLNGPDSPARHCLQDGQSRATELALDSTVCCPPSPRARRRQCIFQVTTAPLANAAGEVREVVELAEDITAAKETQANLIQAGKLAAAGELASHVAHEVNNPISIIIGKTRLLLSDHRQTLPAPVAQELHKIAELAERVARIAQGLLSTVRPSSASRTRLDLRTPVRKSLALVRDRARRVGVRIEDFLPGEALPVSANADALEQVFLNLFLNALDAMPNGGRLRISARWLPLGPDEAQEVAVEVEDTGAGVPPENRDRIFEPFFTTKQEGRGTGLGLSICRGLVSSHQGAIEVQSEPGAGARFIVRLPLLPSARPETEVPHG